MPVAARDKVKALASDLGGQARLAHLLGVSRSRVSRWLRDEQPDGANRRRIDDAEFVLSRLLELYDLGGALRWLEGINAHLGDRRPVELLRAGRVAEVLAAIEAESGLAYA